MIKEGSNNGDQDHVRLEKKEKMISSDSGLPSLPKADNLLIEKERLSVCLITKNEERNIKSCLDSLVGLADEVIVVDSGSTDRTCEIARVLDAKIFTHPFDDFAHQKTRAIEKASFSWVMVIDADERVTPELSKEILQYLKSPEKISQVNGFYVNRLNFFLGKPIHHSGWSPDWLLRIFRKEAGRFDGRMVHESVVVSGDTARIDGFLLHDTHPTIETFIQKNLVYARLWAQERSGTGKPSFFALLFHPPAMFFKMYIVKLGFLDGFSGFVLAVLYSYHVFVKYLMLFDQPSSLNDQNGVDS